MLQHTTVELYNNDVCKVQWCSDRCEVKHDALRFEQIANVIVDDTADQWFSMWQYRRSGDSRRSQEQAKLASSTSCFRNGRWRLIAIFASFRFSWLSLSFWCNFDDWFDVCWWFVCLICLIFNGLWFLNDRYSWCNISISRRCSDWSLQNRLNDLIGFHSSHFSCTRWGENDASTK